MGILDDFGPITASWSWASISLVDSTAVSYQATLQQEVSVSEEFALVDAKIETIGKDSFTSISKATLTVKGWLCECTPLLTGSSPYVRVVNGFTKRPTIAEPVFLDDARFPIEEGSRFFYLYIGEQGGKTASKPSYFSGRHRDDKIRFFGLVLREVLPKGGEYQRAGVLIHHYEDWKDRFAAMIQEVVLV